MAKVSQWEGEAQILFNHLIVKHNKSGLKSPAVEEELEKEHDKLHAAGCDHAEWNMAPSKKRRKSNVSKD
jgi:hypothetical protein